MPLNPASSCPNCGKPLSENAPMGLCPECLLKAGFGTVTDEGQAGGAQPFTPPTPEELRACFPQLEILELLGRGGMGAVYRARQKRLDRLVALKILPRGISDRDPSFAERFEREARALAQMHHPRIVTLYEFGEADGLFYFLMEFVDGLNLRQVLDAGRLAPKEALAIVPQICEALQFAHDRGIVHRDIKPENIMLNRDGQVKIADFGVARIVARAAAESNASGNTAPSAEPLQTEVGKVVGTPQYMAPEQISAPLEVDHRADIYALGVVFYQMLTGELPAARLEPPSRKVTIDVRLDEIVLRALEKEPERRYQQASVFKTQVETIANSAGTGTVSPRLSRAAIAGACWIPFFFAAAAFLVFEPRHVPFPYQYKFPAAMAIILSLSGCFGTTVLGWVAVTQVRRAAGRIDGLGLAVFDGLLFPTLALDYVIGWLLFQLGIALHFWTRNYDSVSNAQLIVASMLVWAVVDALIIRTVWRVAKRNPVNIGQNQPTPAAPRTKSSLVYLAVGLGSILLGGLLVFGFLSYSKSKASSEVASQSEAVNFHYRVFEADAARVDELIPMNLRQWGAMRDLEPKQNASYAQPSLTQPDSPANSVFDASQRAEVLASKVALLLSPATEKAAEPLLKEQTRLISGWPAIVDSWAYSKADGTLLGGGMGTGTLGVRRTDGGLEIRLEYLLTHSINALSDRSGKQWQSRILYQGSPAQPNHSLVFLVPFTCPDESAKYLVIAFDTSMATTNAPATAVIAQLPGGASVELWGVAAYSPNTPRGRGTPRQWWSPDGAVIPDPPVYTEGAEVHPGADKRAREFVIRVNQLPPGADAWPEWDFESGSEATAGESVYLNATGKPDPDLRGVIASLPASAKRMNLRLGFGISPWETVLKQAVEAGSNMTGFNWDRQSWSVSFGKAEEVNGATHLTIVHTARDLQVRVVAVDSAGKEHAPERSGSSGNTAFVHLAVSFDHLLLTQISEFRFQVRPYSWVEFRDVSLEPGQLAKVNVVGATEPASIPTPPTMVSPASGSPLPPSPLVTPASSPASPPRAEFLESQLKQAEQKAALVKPQYDAGLCNSLEMEEANGAAEGLRAMAAGDTVHAAEIKLRTAEYKLRLIETRVDAGAASVAEREQAQAAKDQANLQLEQARNETNHTTTLKPAAADAP